MLSSGVIMWCYHLGWEHPPFLFFLETSLTPCWNWNSPTPSLASESAPPPGTKGWGAHSPAGKGLGSPNSDDWRKSLALCLPCGLVELRHSFCLVWAIPTTTRSTFYQNFWQKTFVYAKIRGSQFSPVFVPINCSFYWTQFGIPWLFMVLYTPKYQRWFCLWKVLNEHCRKFTPEFRSMVRSV
jgi:hypothetical protein